MFKILKKYTLQIIFSIILVILIVPAFLDILPGLNLNWFGKEPDESIRSFHYFCLLALTAILIIVAWIQLSGIQKISKADFLLRMDDRYGSEQIIKARTIIHQLDCQTHSAEICPNTHIEKIAQRIKEMDADENSAEKFIYLLNFLDFLETTAYFCEKKFISPQEFMELMEGSLGYYYKIFKPWIYSRREKYNNDNYYRELENLVGKMNPKKPI